MLTEITVELSTSYATVIDRYNAEIAALATRLAEVQARRYDARPRSELLQLCSERWLTIAGGAPVTRHTSDADLLDALESSDDQEIDHLCKMIGRLLDLVAVCEEMSEKAVA